MFIDLDTETLTALIPVTDTVDKQQVLSSGVSRTKSGGGRQLLRAGEL
jgi:hypothetical protein